MRLLLPLLALGLASAAGAQPLFDAPWTAYNYSSHTPYADRPTAHHMAVADVTGDGRPDAVLPTIFAQPPDRIGFIVMPGDGAGGFGAPSRLTNAAQGDLAFGSWDLVVEDFDGDGDRDVVTLNANGSALGASTVALYRNAGGGTFEAPAVYPVGDGGGDIVAADFDGDGRLDLAVTNNDFGTGTTFVTLRNTGGAFAAPVPFTLPGAAPHGLAAGDFTGDGRPDLAVTHMGGTAPIRVRFSIYASDGAGGFSPVGSYYEPGRMGNLAITPGDMDRDGDLDLVVERSEDGPSGSGLSYSAFVVYHNDGAGAFGNPRSVRKEAYTTPAPNNAVADLNGDGWLDLISLYGNGPQVALSDGTGGFLPIARYAAGEITEAVGVGDLDADGDLDLLSLDRESRAVTVHENPGDGRFPVADSWDVGAHLNLHLDLGDVDADGDLDALTTAGESTAQCGYFANGRVSINDGTGAFPTSRPVERPCGISNGKLRDMDADGDLDVVAHSPDTNPPYDFFTALNDGAGQFGPLTRHPLNSCGWGDTDAFDFDNDGDLDVVNLEQSSCMNGGDGGLVYLSRNRGDATFDPPVTVQLLVGIHSMTGGDFNGDGDLDLAVANVGQSAVHVLLGGGDLTFTVARYPVGTQPYDVEAADLDGDGDLDLATTNVGGFLGQTVSVILNDGAGQFGPPTNYESPLSNLRGTSGLAVADVDGDGDVDLLAGGSWDGAAVYLNDGAGAFAYQPYRYGLWHNPYDVHVADVTGDGIGDMVAIVDQPPPFPETHLAVVRGLAAPVVGVEGPTPADPDVALALSAPAPNPARGAVRLTLTLGPAQDVTVALYDALGRRVATLHEGPLAVGSHALTLDASALAPGVYVVRAAGVASGAARRLVVGR